MTAWIGSERSLRTSCSDRDRSFLLGGTELHLLSLNVAPNHCVCCQKHLLGVTYRLFLTFYHRTVFRLSNYAAPTRSDLHKIRYVEKAGKKAGRKAGRAAGKRRLVRGWLTCVSSCVSLLFCYLNPYFCSFQLEQLVTNSTPLSRSERSRTDLSWGP